MEREVIDEINRVRADPHEHAQELRDYRSWFEGRVVYRPGSDTGMQTVEGVPAVDEAIAFLERQAPLPPLDPSELLALAAHDHADEQAESGAVGHFSPNGRNPGDRVKARGGDIYVGETISYGADDAAEQRVPVADGGHQQQQHARVGRDYRVRQQPSGAEPPAVVVWASRIDRQRGIQ